MEKQKEDYFKMNKGLLGQGSYKVATYQLENYMPDIS